MNARRVAVIGAGVSGLAAAHRLEELKIAARQAMPLQTAVFEASPRAGGIIETEQRDGFLLEKGPDAFVTDKPAALTLCRRLGLENELIGTCPEYRKSLVARGGRLIAVPEGFYLIAPVRLAPFLKSSLFSPLGKLRMLAEIFVPRRASSADESMADFVTRRFGREALDRAGQPLIGGIYTGDPSELSLESTMPRLAALERDFGSVTRGLRHEKSAVREAGEASGPRYSLFVSFKNGMETFTAALERALPPGTLRLSTPVETLVFDGASQKWGLKIGEKTEVFDAVLSTLPARLSAGLAAPVSPVLAERLGEVRYESVATVNLAYPEAAVPRSLEAFGFVVPRSESSAIVACSFSHRKFAGRAPAGKALLRAFVGGAFGKSFFEKPDDQVLAETKKELRRYLGIAVEPLFASLTRYTGVMVQYRVGHAALCRSIEAEAAKLPGFYLAGAAYRGVGIPDCVAEAERQAETIFNRFI